MVIIFRNNRGKNEVLSPGRVRKNLAQLVGEQSFTDVQDLDVQELAGSNQGLVAFFSKLKLNSVTVDSSDVETALRNMGLTDDRIQIVFAMSRPYFLAVVYLVVSGRAGSEEISRICDLQESTRTDVLLNMIPSRGLEETILSRAFDNAIRGLFSPRDREQLPFDPEYFRKDKSSGTVVNVQFKMVPEAFYLIYNTYLQRIYNNSEPSGWPLNRIHEKWAPNLGIRSKSVTFDSSGVYLHWVNFVEGEDPRYPNFYSYLASGSFDSGINALPKNLRMDLLHSFALNSYLPMAAIRAYRQRNSNQIREWAGFPADQYAAEAVKRGIWFATPADEAADTYLPDYFVLAHFLYHNSGNIGTEDKGLDYWNTFIYNTSPGSSLRSLESSVESEAWSFSYVEEDGVKQFLSELFPVSSVDSERGQSSYMPSLMLSRGDFRTATRSTRSIYDTVSSRMSISRKALARAGQISKFDLRVADSKRIISMGTQESMGFVSDSFKIALDSAAYSNLDLLAVGSDSEMRGYIEGTSETEGIKDSVVSAILSQSGSTPSSQGYNPLISDSNANVLNRYFVADLAGQFFDYLIDPEQDEFSPSLSDEAMSVFRLLNFVKHTFINFESFFDRVAGSDYYKEFVYMILVARAGLYKDDIYNATLPVAGARISIEEIKEVLKKAGEV